MTMLDLRHSAALFLFAFTVVACAETGSGGDEAGSTTAAGSEGESGPVHDIGVDDYGDGCPVTCSNAQTQSAPLTWMGTELGRSRSWGTCAEWSGWIEITTDEQVAANVESGDWTPAAAIEDADCYLFSADALTCTVEVGPFLAIGRPRFQLEPIASAADECDGLDGPWAELFFSPSSLCRGQLEPSKVIVHLTD